MRGEHGRKDKKARTGGALLLAGFVLSACTGTLTYAPAIEMLDRYDRVPPRPDRFTYCFGYGCSTAIEDAELGDAWQAIAARFATAAPNAAEERRRIADAVAQFERAMGARYGTAADKGGTFLGLVMPGQLDCIDETLNTTALLKMLANEGLLAWHAVGAPAQRGFFVDGWPHVTATVVETGTQEAYAIDSWFRDNGQKADVVPVAAWRDGWTPP